MLRLPHLAVPQMQAGTSTAFVTFDTEVALKPLPNAYAFADAAQVPLDHHATDTLCAAGWDTWLTLCCWYDAVVDPKNLRMLTASDIQDR